MGSYHWYDDPIALLRNPPQGAALPNPATAIGYGGGFGLDTQALAGTLTFGFSPFDVDFANAYQLTTDSNHSVPTAVDDEWMGWDPGAPAALVVKKIGWYQACINLEFQDPFPTDALVVSLGNSDQGATIFVPAGTRSGQPVMPVHFGANVTTGVTINAPAAASSPGVITYCALILTPLF